MSALIKKNRESSVRIAAGRCVDLYVVTGDEIPFVQDGLRDGEHIRHAVHERFIERLTEDKKPFVVVRGSKEERLDIE